MLNNFRILGLFLAGILSFSLSAQEADSEVSPFDFGRMWTFEQPPVDWFKEAYGFEADQAWFDDVRKSSLRFASWCSASFVSPNGLIMTNHHCSRDVAISVQQGSENFDDNGYYAATLADERRVDDLFVEQLIKVVDITDEVQEAKAAVLSQTDDDSEVEQAVLADIKSRYESDPNWSGLRIQVVTFYSGGKYSLYGYKKYSDIRLVLIPENDLGFFGGDPDNFTYPRYNLDCTFWRAYDEDGEPLNTADHYYQFNIDGVEEGTPVFVVGNPGRTERYRTTAQLEFDRDYRFKHLLKWITERRDHMLSKYEIMSKDESQVRAAQDLLSSINNLSNSIKAYEGIQGGLHNESFMNRKAVMEDQLRKNSEVDYWKTLENEYEKLKPHAWAINLLGQSSYRGKVLSLMFETNKLQNLLTSDDVNEEELADVNTKIEQLVTDMDVVEEKKLFTILLNELKSEIFPGDNTLTRLLDGKTIDSYVNDLFDSSSFLKSADTAKKFMDQTKKIKKAKDPLLQGSKVLMPRYQESAAAFQASSAKRKGLESNIANQAFQVFGTSLPPDATFTLRISDGLVKGYNYNGTTAPVTTTYFGLYDRHYSNGQKFPWGLPEKWANPPMELLKSPMNFISTNDIIGGNSGSAIINQKGEAVGLIFDGNIESLPGNFIFDEEANRSVSVHAGGIYAAMKYIYKADRIISELLPE